MLHQSNPSTCSLLLSISRASSSLIRFVVLSQNTSHAINSASLEELAAHYLLTAKRDDKLPVDPVARFHLGNGAAVHAVHAGADTSDNGMRQSKGAMVNYLYGLSLITTNHEQFVTDKTVAASPAVTALSATISSTS